MPALPPVAKVLKVALKIVDVIGRIAIVTDHLKYTGSAPTNGDLTSLASATATAWGNHLKSLHSDKWTLEQVDITDLSSPTSAFGSVGVSIAGTASGFLPADACAVVRQQIGRRYRGGHPKQFWPAGVESNLQDPSTWNTTFTVAWTSAFSAFRGDQFAAVWSAGGVLSPVNVSYYSGFTNVTFPSGRIRAVPTRRVTPLVDDVLNETIRDQVGSQRRRQSTNA